MEVELLETESVWKPARLRGSLVDQDETADLYKKVRSILNKLTPQKFDTLLHQFEALPIDNNERMHGVIDLLFEKAISEPMYSALYAQVCKVMINKQVVDGAENGQPVAFRRQLISRCQHEFEKSGQADRKRDERLTEIERCTDPERKQTLQLEFEEMGRQLRMKSVGNMKFIGELFKIHILTSNLMCRCIIHLLKWRDEVSLEYLCVLLTTIGKHIERKCDLSEYFEEMKVLSMQRGQIPFHVRFMLQEVIELRDNKWVSKRDDSVPKAIDQIEHESMIEVLMLSGVQVRDIDRKKGEGSSGARQQYDQRKYLYLPSSRLRIKVSELSNVSLCGTHQFGPQLRGMDSDSDSKFPVTSDAPADLQEVSTEESSVALSSRPDGKQETSSDTECEEVVDTGHNILSTKSEGHQIQTVSKTTPLESTGSECSSEAQAHARSSSESCDDVAAVDSDVSDGDLSQLSPDRTEEKIQFIVEEFLGNNNIQESLLSISEEFPPSDMGTFVVGALTFLLDQSASVRSDVGNLLSHLLKEGVLTTQQLLQGLKEVARAADDVGTDMPEVWLSLAEILVSVLSAEVLSSSDMKTATTVLHKMVFTILHLLQKEKGPYWISQRWDLTGINWKDFSAADSKGGIVKESDPHQKVLALLNELRPENVHLLMQKLEVLIINNSQQLPDVVDLVFEKAVSEPTNSAVYAEVCEALSEVRQRGGGEDGSPRFRALLLRRCRHEFEINWLAGVERDRRLAEVEMCTDPVEREKMLSEMDTMLRMKYVGFIRFIGELFKLGMLTQNVMHRYIQGLLKQRDDVSLECLCELLTAVGKRIDGRKREKERGIEKEEEKEAGGERVDGDNRQRSAGLPSEVTEEEKEGEAAEDPTHHPVSPVSEQIHGEGQWSPFNPDSPKKYERDFLIKLRDTPEAKKKPQICSDVLNFLLKDNVDRPRLPDLSRGPHDNFTRTFTKSQSYQRDLSKYFEEIEVFSKQNGQISSRVRSMLQNVIELRDNNWVPRRDGSTQKTIKQIQCKAERESTIEMLMQSGGGGGSCGVGRGNQGGDWRK